MAVALLLHPQHFLSIRTQIALDRVGGVGSGEWGVGSGEWGAKGADHLPPTTDYTLPT